MVHRMISVVTLTCTLALACSRAPEKTGSRLLDRDRDSNSAVVGFTISSDGVDRKARLEISFGDFDLRPARETAGKKESSGLGAVFREIVSLFDRDPAPTGGPNEASGRPMTREAGERVFRGDFDATAAKRSGKTEEREERYQSLRAAEAAFKAQMADVAAANAARFAAATYAADSLERLINGSTQDHNAKVRVIVASAEDILAAAAAIDAERIRTDPSTPAGQRLAAAARNLTYAASRLEESEGALKVTRQELIAMARAALDTADQMYGAGDPEGGDIALEMAYALTDAVLGFVPGVGWAKDVCEAMSGVSLVTGAVLSDTDRVVAAVGVLTGGVGSKISNVGKLKSVMKRLGASKKLRGGEKLSAVSAEAARLVDPAKEALEAMGPKKFGEVLKAPKGTRPLPETYLPKEYIETHLAKFDEGASKFIQKGQFEKYGPAQVDGTAFVLPKTEADALIAQARGDRRALEEALGFEKGFLDNNELVRVDVSKPRDMGIRVPSHNDAGENHRWLPGGKHPQGHSEAVIDLGAAPTGSWTSETLEFKP